MKSKLDFVVKFLKETRGELKKVVWPDRRYITVATIVILILVVLTAGYVMFVDYLFTNIFAVLLK